MMLKTLLPVRPATSLRAASFEHYGKPKSSKKCTALDGSQQQVSDTFLAKELGTCVRFIFPAVQIQNHRPTCASPPPLLPPPCLPHPPTNPPIHPPTHHPPPTPLLSLHIAALFAELKISSHEALSILRDISAATGAPTPGSAASGGQGGGGSSAGSSEVKSWLCFVFVTLFITGEINWP